MPQTTPIIKDPAPPAIDLPGSSWIPVGLLLGLVWLLVFYHVHTGWMVNVVYSYGWAVPVLACYLAWQRWGNRPPRSRPASPYIISAAAIILLIAYLPVRVVHEANPDWVKANWSIMGIAAALTALVAWSAGGVRYVRHFAFPVLLCFKAVPWPVWLETTLVQELMKMNASICAEVLTLFGLPALAQGNLIQIATTWLNVEEACSGIRSLQTSFMMGLFLGEFYQFNLVRRAAMLAAALGLAFVSNMLRTIVLAYAAAAGSLERWHDTVGNVAMIATLAAIWLCSRLMSPRTQPSTVGSSHPVSATRDPFYIGFPPWLAVAGCVAIIASEFLTQAWYRAHERKIAAAQEWTLIWPQQAREFRQHPFHERTRALLHFDSGESTTWVDSSGYRWGAYFLKWQPGRVSKFLAMSHYPTVCLPATGLTLVTESGPWECRANGIRIPFTNYVFNDGGRDVYVFHAIIEDRPLKDDFRFSYYQVTSTERLASVLRGERNLGQRVIGIALRGCTSPTEAQSLVEESLKRMVTTTRYP